MEQPNTSNTRCTTSGFNYCLFSKSLVALPALSLIAYIPTTFSDNAFLQLTSAILAVAGAVAIAIWLDRIPLLKKKISLFTPSK